MNTRLKQFLAAENITQAQFADTIDVVRASVSHVLSGRNNPSYDFIRAIMQHYPSLNMEWLMFGKGKMYKETNKDTSDQEMLLFEDTHVVPEVSDSISHHDDEITAALVDDSSKNAASNEIKTIIKEVQISAAQRKVSKIIVLFDDGSYQEL